MGTVGNIVVAGINIALSIDGTNIGYTQDGVSIQHPIDYLDLEADQSIDIIGKKRIKERCTLKTNMEEATLANIKIAMGEENALVTSGGTSRLSFGGGVVVTEHALVFVGLAPGTSKTRKFTAYKAVSVSQAEFSYKKGNQTLIPVTFELVADTAKPEGEQYGYYQDDL